MVSIIRNTYTGYMEYRNAYFGISGYATIQEATWHMANTKIHACVVSGTKTGHVLLGTDKHGKKSIIVMTASIFIYLLA